MLKPGIGDRVRIDLRFLRLSARVLDLLPGAAGPRRERPDRRPLPHGHRRARPGPRGDVHRLPPRADGRGPIAHYAPRVYRELSSRNVLTLERIHGVTVREMLTATTNGNGGMLEAWAARGITPRRTAVILLRSVLEQTMRYRTFNADPHPSNLIVSDGGTLNWVDFGAVGWIDERQWELQLRLRDAIANEQIHQRVPRPAREHGAAALPEPQPVRTGDQADPERLPDRVRATRRRRSARRARARSWSRRWRPCGATGSP